MLSKTDYLIPQIEGKINFHSLYKDSKEVSDLEKSWKSLNAFQKTHKGRLDSAKNDFSQRNVANPIILPATPIVSNSDIGANAAYSPSILESRMPIRSKSEMSNYVPFYMYPHDQELPPTDKSWCANDSLNKSKSIESIYEYYGSSYSRPKLSIKEVEQTKDVYFEPNSIERRLNEYKLKVDQENRLRERIINELLNENERITERLKCRNSINKMDKRKLLRSPSFEDMSSHRLYNKNSKYKSSHCSGRGCEKNNLVEYYVDDSSPIFVIPELPTGKVLKIFILNTWGDRHYVGLNGIEIFGSDGRIADVKNISASPADVNVLSENHDDPRVVKNLLDGVNRTQDDVHLWLTPFEEGAEHTITVTFMETTRIAMIRIWNYNKSRIHSFRGIRDAIVTLDRIPIFKGEIAKACGGILGGVDAFGDTILFTTDDNILELISQNDDSYTTLTMSTKVESEIITERPPTAATMDNRPFTGAPQQKQSADVSITKEQILLGANRMDIVLLSNWGYANIIGLTGLEIIGASDSSIFLTENNISCNSMIKNVNKKGLIGGENITTDISNMWWLPYKSGQYVVITIQFNQFSYISGIRIWNYNQSPETSYAGVHIMKIFLDEKPLLNPLRNDELFLIRRAPGNTHYDFVQDVRFTVNDHAENPNYLQMSATFGSLNLREGDLPEGFVFQFIIFSTWGDQYYCGLNGIELFNEFGSKILLEEQNVCAYPESINVLPGVVGDIRTPDKLIDGVTNDNDGAHSWLAPIIPKCLNRIYIVLDQPITVSLIKLWNYSKTASRGVKEFGVLVDDLLVYNGVLDKYGKKKGGPMHRSILFTNDKRVVEQEVGSYIRHSCYNQEVILFDENRTTTGGSLPNPDQTLRPFTSVSPFDKGYVSH